MPDSNARVRWTIIFSGIVQGVGFRFTTERVARRFEVTGYVRNLPDGGVETVAEGLRSELKRFVGEIEAVMGGYIRDRKLTESPETGEFRSFSIKI